VCNGGRVLFTREDRQLPGAVRSPMNDEPPDSRATSGSARPWAR
jgi:hypothetical protein